MTDATQLGSLAAIRKRHGDLMRQSFAAAPSLVPEVLNFVEQVAQAGAFLEAPDERDTAQNILDYWNASLLAVSKRVTGDRSFTELHPFEKSGREENALPRENPFYNARALGRDDQALLVGREDAIRAVVERVRQHPIVFVTDTVGSGRTSLVMAGVVPRLAGGASGRRCLLALSSPSSDPIGALGGVVANTSSVDLRHAPGLLRAKVEEACGDRAALLVVDNVEELFTRCSDQPTRELFAEAIASVVAEPRRHSVILIVDDEWVDSVSEFAAFKPYATPAARFSPPPPTAGEVQRVLTALANNARLRIAPGLSEDLAQELQGDRAAVSLARFMLLHLWPLSKGGFIDWGAYQHLGRPNEALDRVAEQTYGHLSVQGRSAAQRLFLTLAKPKLGGASSQRQNRRRLDPDGSDAAMTEAIEAFSREGLLRESTLANDPDNADFALIHNNLWFQWERFRNWLEGERRNSERRLQVTATVQLWNDSGRSSGYLFTDDESIMDARRFLDSTQDPLRDTLRDFIHASVEALNKIRRRRQLYLYTALGLATTVGLVLASFLAIVFYYRSNQQEFINREINRLTDLTATANYNRDIDQTDRDLTSKIKEIFRTISFYQNFGSSEISISNVNLYNVKLSDVLFDNLRFIDSRLQNVDLSGSRDAFSSLENSAFIGGYIIDSSFKMPNLSFSQFRNIKLRRVNFFGANLSRASFDNAQLCDVEFTGANLRYATFSNTSFDPMTAASLRNSAWWFAEGWTQRQVDELVESAKQQIPDVSKFDDFIVDRKRAEQHVAKAQLSNDDAARALAFNDLAWTLAIYGIDLLSDGKNNTKSDDCGAGGGIPKSAEKSALDAICVIDRLRTVNKDGKEYKDYRSALEDTLGYIYLQSRQVDAALVHLQIATNNGSTEASGGALLRLAVAENASGKTETAIMHMKMAIDKGYVPTHERRLLAKYLGPSELGRQLDQLLNDLDPPHETVADCPQ